MSIMLIIPKHRTAVYKKFLTYRHVASGTHWQISLNQLFFVKNRKVNYMN